MTGVQTCALPIYKILQADVTFFDGFLYGTFDVDITKGQNIADIYNLNRTENKAEGILLGLRTNDVDGRDKFYLSKEGFDGIGAIYYNNTNRGTSMLNEPKNNINQLIQKNITQKESINVAVYHQNSTNMKIEPIQNEVELKYLPSDLNFVVSQYSEIKFEYVGDPIYIPESANPNKEK